MSIQCKPERRKLFGLYLTGWRVFLVNACSAANSEMYDVYTFSFFHDREAVILNVGIFSCVLWYGGVDLCR